MLQCSLLQTTKKWKSGGMKGHIQKRGANSWRIKVDTGRDPLTGKRATTYVTVRGTKKYAQRELARMIHEVETGHFVELSKMALSEYLEHWIEDYAQTAVSRSTFERYSELLRLHVIPHLSAVPLSKLKPLHIQKLYGGLLTNGRRDGTGGLAPQTVKHVHRVLHQALQHAVRWQMISLNPAASVDPPKVERRQIDVLSNEEARELVEASRGTRLYAPIVLALNSGLRRGEILGLRWQDLDFEGRQLSVTQSVEQTSAGLRLKEPKTKRSRRSITLPDVAIETLRKHKIQQSQNRLRLGRDYQDNDLVFPQLDGNLQNPRVFSKDFKRLATRIGLDHVTLHGLRHTHLTMLLRANVHPKIASERAGHSSVAITLDIYSHAVPNMQEDAARVMDELFKNAEGE